MTRGFNPFFRSANSHQGLRKALPLSAVTLTRLGSPALRVTRWQGEPDRLLVGPGRLRRGISTRDVEVLIQRSRAHQVREIYTPALSWLEAEPFFAAGFGISEELHLLTKHLIGEPKILPAPTILSSKRRHRAAVLDIDGQAFEGFWRFDRAALKAACRATPASFFRVALGKNSRPIGYAIMGQASARGYLQRLAVAPAAQGQGVATALVNDGLRWLWERRVRTVLVNTQQNNWRALQLYKQLGFEPESTGLFVLRWGNETQDA